MPDENEDEKEVATTLPGFEEEKEQPEEDTGILPGLLDEEDEEIVANKEEQEKLQYCQDLMTMTKKL